MERSAVASFGGRDGGFWGGGWSGWQFVKTRGLLSKQEKYAKLFFVAENGPFGTPFWTPQVSPKKFMWVPFLRPFPGNEAHHFFLGAQNGVFWVGAKKFYENPGFPNPGFRNL